MSFALKDRRLRAVTEVKLSGIRSFSALLGLQSYPFGVSASAAQSIKDAWSSNSDYFGYSKENF